MTNLPKNYTPELINHLAVAIPMVDSNIWTLFPSNKYSQHIKNLKSPYGGDPEVYEFENINESQREFIDYARKERIMSNGGTKNNLTTFLIGLNELGAKNDSKE